MRIGTWNVERGVGRANAARRECINRSKCDVWVLTETSRALRPAGLWLIAASRRQQTGPQHFVAIWSRAPGVALHTANSEMTAAAILRFEHRKLLVFGVVLPWPPHWDAFDRALAALARDCSRLRRAYPAAAFCLVGDLNCDFESGVGFPGRSRTARLRRILKASGLITITHLGRRPRLSTWARTSKPIDHIAVPALHAIRARVSLRWSGAPSNAPRLSDHEGVAVDIV